MESNEEQTSKDGVVTNLSHLIDPRCFQQLPKFSPPDPFKIDPEAIANYDLDQLVQKKLYLPAAARAQTELCCMTSAEDYDKIFKLWYVRISCLVLAKLFSIAKEESRHLGELGADRYRLEDGTCIAPWDLRLLLVRVQGGGDSQVGLNRYYSLSREARAESVKAQSRGPQNNPSSVYISAEWWRERLRKLGLYVAAMLMGMNDYTAAIDHLTSLYEASSTSRFEENRKFSNQVAPTLALAYLQIGDTISAREWFQKVNDEKAKSFASAVCSMADADWAAASSTLHERYEHDGNATSTEVVNNLALAKLHEGDLKQAIELLETLVKDNTINSTVLFNLFTLYDLLQDISIQTKSELLKSLRCNGVESLGTYEFLRAGIL